MLCEGPTSDIPFSDDFISLRKSFLLNDRPEDKPLYDNFSSNFQSLQYEAFDRIVLWFEYDLFCHVNMAAALTYMRSFCDLPLTLICPGTFPGHEGLYGLNELSDPQLEAFYESTELLEDSAEEMLKLFWATYNDNDPRKFQDIDWDHSSLPYLKECVKAHLQRFPSEYNGLNSLENLVLESVENNRFNTVRNCMGFLLGNQGYYGFGDLQWARIILKVMPFLNTTDILALSLTGQERLKGLVSSIQGLRDKTQFGGASKYDYVYTEDQKLELR